jgi:RNA polymerase sigma factor (sigma-70 family)
MIASTRGALVLRLFNEHYERVYWFARRSVDTSTAEDVAQEVFVRLLRIVDLEERVVTCSYLIKVADNLIKRRHKQKVQHDRFAGVQASPTAAYQARTAEEPVEGKCTGALGHLSDTEQAALRLIVCEGLSYEAAALALDVKVSTVNNWKFRGIQKLRLVADGSRVGSLAG